MERVAQNH